MPRALLREESSRWPPIDVSPVCDTNHQHDELFVPDFVHDAVVPHGTLSSIVILALATSATATIATTGDSDADDETFTVALGALPPFVTAGATSSVVVTITDDDTAQEQTQDPPPAGPHAALVAKMKAWRNDPRWVSYKAHTDRWDRALLAFGETVPDGSLTAMTAAEAEGYADAATGLSVEAKARMLLTHADSDYEEWGASATARLDPGERGRGLSFSLAPIRPGAGRYAAGLANRTGRRKRRGATGTNRPASASPSGSQYYRRQVNTWWALTLYRRATTDTETPGSRLSATIWRFWASLHRRRRRSTAPPPAATGFSPETDIR